MNRHFAVMLAACASMSPALPLVAQNPSGWNDGRALELVRRAVERRAAQLADTGLIDYTARAHGYLTFLAQLGEGFPEPPRVLKADELVLEVYWRAPGYSKQRIIGRRDTLLLPTDINYHRDHLGIVQNNFPGIIRLGDGDEVQDVPHPLSVAGMVEYDFAITDSLTLNLGNRELSVYEVRFRPKDDRLPRAVGALYLDRAEGQVARMTLGFTRSALRDRQLDDVSIVLDNGLVDGRFWLPRRQSIEIRRSGSWMEFPARGIIRGRWEICCVEVNKGIDPSAFTGQEIVSAPPDVLREYRWEGRVVDSLPPDITTVREDDIRKIQSDARQLVRSQALERARTLGVSAMRVSDLVRVNRVEGLSFGLGLRQGLGNGYSLGVKGRYGTRDEQGKVNIEFRRELASGGGVALRLYRDFKDAGDVPETSGLKNSIAAQEFGADFTDPFDVRGGGGRLDLPGPAGTKWFLSGELERQAPLAVHARPARGRYRPVPPVWRSNEVRFETGLLRALGPVRGGATLIEMSSALRLAWNRRRREASEVWEDGWYGRGHVQGRLERPASAGRLVAAGRVTALLWTRGRPVMDAPGLPGGPGVPGWSDLPPQLLVYLGGPVTGPGYGFHQFSGEFGSTGRVEWQFPVPFFRMSLGRFGQTGNRAVLAPFAHTLIVGGGSAGALLDARPSLGVGLLTFFDVLRLDVARGLRGGRWTFSVDVNSAFWGIL